MPASHPHQLLRQLSQPTESVAAASTSAVTSAWLSQSSVGPCAATAAATAVNPPMSSSSSSSSSSWPGHSSVPAEMPVLIRQSPVSIKQDMPTDAFQPPPSGNVPH